ncbi:MAG: hypothetical protein K2K72_04065 [Duncaniella sp.]|nr:hypothetical protein [Duncaniella sp.]
MDGGEVSSSPLLLVEVTDRQSGPYLGFAAPGASPVVRLDGKSQPELARLLIPEAEGVATLTHRLEDLSDGRHVISVAVSDRAGNRVCREVPFTVVSTIASTLTASSTVARDEVTFDLIHLLYLPEGKSFESSRLIVRDLAGNHVTVIEHPAYPYTWDLRDSQGNPVVDGTYRVSATLATPPFYTATPEITVTVVR